MNPLKLKIKIKKIKKILKKKFNWTIQIGGMLRNVPIKAVETRMEFLFRRKDRPAIISKKIFFKWIR